MKEAVVEQEVKRYRIMQEKPETLLEETSELLGELIPNRPKEHRRATAESQPFIATSATSDRPRDRTSGRLVATGREDEGKDSQPLEPTRACSRAR